MPEMQSTRKKKESTQKYLKISEIREDAIVLKDGGLRGIVAVSSTNFALKSEDEQNALVSAYQGFLNSLDFPIQILVQSRILDIQGYLNKLRGLSAGQTNELLRIQMEEYTEYVGKLVEFANIMSKNFYVIVPLSTNPTKQTFFSKFTNVFSPTGEIVRSKEEFRQAKIKLDERVNHVSSQLASIGLRSMVLKTDELIELVYQSYNFESATPLNAEALQGIDIGEAENSKH